MFLIQQQIIIIIIVVIIVIIIIIIRVIIIIIVIITIIIIIIIIIIININLYGGVSSIQPRDRCPYHCNTFSELPKPNCVLCVFASFCPRWMGLWACFRNSYITGTRTSQIASKCVEIIVSLCFYLSGYYEATYIFV